MGKYYGHLGYGITKEIEPGIWDTVIEEREVFGDVLKNTKQVSGSDKVNDDISISDQISFLADPYIKLNFHLVKYITYLGTKWKITSVSEDFPRLIVTLGGVYNENKT